MSQLGLLAWSPPVAAPRAPEGVKRAAKAGSRVDEAVLAACHALAGRPAPGNECSEGEFWLMVNAVVACAADTPRRRRDAIEDQGLLRTEDAGTGRFRVVEVRW